MLSKLSYFILSQASLHMSLYNSWHLYPATAAIRNNKSLATKGIFFFVFLKSGFLPNYFLFCHFYCPYRRNLAEILTVLCVFGFMFPASISHSYIPPFGKTPEYNFFNINFTQQLSSPSSVLSSSSSVLSLSLSVLSSATEVPKSSRSHIQSHINFKVTTWSQDPTNKL